MNNRRMLFTLTKMTPLKKLSLAVAAITCSSPLFALPTLNFDNGLSIQSQLTAAYTLSTRTGKASSVYLADPNNDDGTRNFDQWDLVNNRVSLFGEVITRYKDVGAVVRASHFYDDVYHSSNSNDSPGTVNQGGHHQKFTSKTKDRSGGEARLLDAYVFGNFALDDSKFLSVKAGRHLVAWGESLFWPNISQGQAPVDATKFNVPGTEAKDAYLPAGQVSFNLALNDHLTLTGFWQYKWEETLINPVGDFFGADFFGPGSEYMLGDDGFGNLVPVASNAGDIKPSDSGQWGIGARFSPDFNTEFGLYHYRYHDRVPSLLFGLDYINFQDTHYSTAGASVPVGTYKFKYFEDIKLTGLSVSTKVADSVQIGGDISYRDGAAVLLENGSPTTGEILQTNVNAIYVLGSSWLAHQTTLMGEVLNQQILGVDTLTITNGLNGPSEQVSTYKHAGQTKSSSTLGLGVLMDYPSIFQGWDLATNVMWMQNVQGSGIQGFGRDEKRLTMGADFTYMHNFSVGATWVNYLSSANVEKGRLMSDRDHLAINFKYTL